MKYLTIILLLLTNGNANATNYYFSNSGKNNNSGKSALAAWRNISKINAIKLKPGDSILLKRGDLFEGNIELKNSGTFAKPIVVSAYGTGPAPILTGAKQLGSWNQKNGIYNTPLDMKASDLYVNDVKQTLARYPNKGFITLDSGKNKQIIYSDAIKDIPGILTDAFVRVRSIDWVYEIRKVKSFTSNSISLGYHNLYPVDKAFASRTGNGIYTIYDLKKGYGFYLDGLPQFIDEAKEWSISKNELLYMPSSNIDINKAKVEVVVYQNGIVIASGVKNVSIENIQIEKYFLAAIKTGVNVHKVNINNCLIKNIHVYGIQMDSLSRECKITNNTITDILGKGIAVLEPEYLLVEGNEVKRIGLDAGQGFSGVNGASAISIENHESKTWMKAKYANNNKIRLNHIDSCGYNGIRVDGSYNLVEYNVIENCGLTLNDGSALYCYAAQVGITHNQVFRRNIVKNSRGNIEATPANGIHFNGIYIDNNCHNILIEENTSINNSSTGLMNNDGSYKNTFTGNNALNNKTGIGMYEWGRPAKLFDILVKNNTIASTIEDQKLVDDVNYLDSKTNFAVFEKNRYIHTSSTNPFYKETKQSPQNSKLNLTFTDWQKIGYADENSTALLADSDLLKDFTPEIIINESLNEKEYNLDKANYRGSDGKDITSPIKLSAYQSVIVLKRK